MEAFEEGDGGGREQKSFARKFFFQRRAPPGKL